MFVNSILNSPAMHISTRQARKFSVLIGLLLLLNGCATSVTVKGEVPTPLVQKVPLTAQLIYHDAFKSYTYEEADKQRTLKSLNFGQAQMALFDNVFDAILSRTDNNPDLIIVPEVIDFQYTVPRETKLNLYEVWLKYRLKVTDANNQELADWVIKGYGKTPTATLTTPVAAFNAAANVALRDVGAQLAIGFVRQDRIKALLTQSTTEENVNE